MSVTVLSESMEGVIDSSAASDPEPRSRGRLTKM
jgi:hypothetical protein